MISCAAVDNWEVVKELMRWEDMRLNNVGIGETSLKIKRIYENLTSPFPRDATHFSSVLLYDYGFVIVVC